MKPAIEEGDELVIAGEPRLVCEGDPKWRYGELSVYAYHNVTKGVSGKGRYSISIGLSMDEGVNKCMVVGSIYFLFLLLVITKDIYVAFLLMASLAFISLVMSIDVLKRSYKIRKAIKLIRLKELSPQQQPHR